MNCTAFFILSHERNHFAFFNALREYANAVAFCGHWHMSNADWKAIFLGDFGFGFFPTIQVGACRMDGANVLDGKERLAKGDLTVAVRPVSSLGTKCKTIGTTFRV